ncbi:MAG: hypothetical protein HQL32_05460 [Planctomycetes bacterium]|nr:hypothetical protein [Planctomycetota bacterium]
MKIFKQNFILKLLALITIFAIIVACGSDGNSITGTSVDGTGTGTSSVSGSITAFGSIYVNGIEIDVDNSSFKSDGQDITESDLRVGMYVTVDLQEDIDSSTSTGVASNVIYDSHIAGPVESLIDESSFKLEGLTIVTSDQTTYKELNGFEDLGIGGFVLLSGYYDANGDFIASFISKGDPSKKFVKEDDFIFERLPYKYASAYSGPISSMISFRSFKIGDVVVIVNDDTVVHAPKNSIYGVGDFVHVRGVRVDVLQYEANMVDIRPPLNDFLHSYGSLTKINLAQDVRELTISGNIYAFNHHTKFKEEDDSGSHFGPRDLEVGDELYLLYFERDDLNILEEILRTK